MLNVCTWLWGNRYTIDHVIRLSKMMRNHLDFNKFILFTDQKIKIEGVDVHKAPERHSDMRGCYRRLPMWTSELRHILGDRVLHCDVDTVIFNDLNHLIDDSPFKIWKCPSIGYHGFAYGPGLSLFTPGYLDDLYAKFCDDPSKTISEAKKNKWTGTDQSIIGNYIHPHKDVWTIDDGVLSFRDHIKQDKPDNICMLGFYGSKYDPSICKLKWVQEAYQ